MPHACIMVLGNLSVDTLNVFDETIGITLVMSILGHFNCLISKFNSPFSGETMLAGTSCSAAVSPAWRQLRMVDYGWQLPELDQFFLVEVVIFFHFRKA